MATDPDAILDAARDAVMAVGVRRMTATDVARRAGVSRMTLYRRYPDVPTLIQALMTREFQSVVDGATEAVAGLPGGRERAVEAAVRTASDLAAHPLFERIVDVDPELLLPYVTTRVGEFQRRALEAFEALLAAGIEDGTIRDADPLLLARVVELSLRGVVFATRALASERDALLEEFRVMLDGYLSP
ncbi:MAG: TetR/AcrR family transcriptional regulator [Thermoleophilaceae bacterium]